MARLVILRYAPSLLGLALVIFTGALFVMLPGLVLLGLLKVRGALPPPIALIFIVLGCLALIGGVAGLRARRILKRALERLSASSTDGESLKLPEPLLIRPVLINVRVTGRGSRRTILRSMDSLGEPYRARVITPPREMPGWELLVSSTSAELLWVPGYAIEESKYRAWGGGKVVVLYIPSTSYAISIEKDMVSVGEGPDSAYLSLRAGKGVIYGRLSYVKSPEGRSRRARAVLRAKRGRVVVLRRVLTELEVQGFKDFIFRPATLNSSIYIVSVDTALTPRRIAEVLGIKGPAIMGNVWRDLSVELSVELDIPMRRDVVDTIAVTINPVYHTPSGG